MIFRFPLSNREDCWRDWWKTGREWIQPEGDE